MKHKSIEFLRYVEDGRVPIERLYKAYDRLLEYGFSKILIATQVLEDGEEARKFPIYGYVGKKTGDALWIFSGVHGEEPPGPIAISRVADDIGKKAREIPVVVAPLLNPIGYFRGWRYQDSLRGGKGVNYSSVGDADAVILNPAAKPAGPYAEKVNPVATALIRFITDKLKTHPAFVSLDLHEDELMKELVVEDEKSAPKSKAGTGKPMIYIYTQGTVSTPNPIGDEILTIMESRGTLRVLKGQTRFGEPIVNGLVVAPRDGSLDQFMGESLMWDGERVVKKHATPHVFVVETPTLDMPLDDRVKIHRDILLHLLNRFKHLKSVSK